MQAKNLKSNLEGIIGNFYWKILDCSTDRHVDTPRMLHKDGFI